MRHWKLIVAALALWPVVALAQSEPVAPPAKAEPEHKPSGPPVPPPRIVPSARQVPAVPPEPPRLCMSSTVAMELADYLKHAPIVLQLIADSATEIQRAAAEKQQTDAETTAKSK